MDREQLAKRLNDFLNIQVFFVIEAIGGTHGTVARLRCFHLVNAKQEGGKVGLVEVVENLNDSLFIHRLVGMSPVQPWPRSQCSS